MSGARLPGAIMPCSSVVSPPSRASRKASWVSSSDAMRHQVRGEIRGAARLFQQNGKRRQVGVPFDQAWHEAEAGERGGVEIPNLAGHGGAVIVDEHGPAVAHAFAVA